MSNIFIVHGTYGTPTENWIPWLRQQLERDGHEVIVPTFPTPENQSLPAWLDVFREYREQITTETVFVGHSLGASFLLSALEELDHPVRATFLVAGFASQLTREESAIQYLFATFLEKEFDWSKIKANAGAVTVIHADNDPFIPFEKAGELARNLGTEITIVQGGGHFDMPAGYDRFDLLLERIRQVL